MSGDTPHATQKLNNTLLAQAVCLLFHLNIPDSKSNGT